MLLKANEVMSGSKVLLAHAPTGIGKTAAVVPVALKHSLNDEIFTLFVTPKHMQHYIVVETVKLIVRKFGIKVDLVDFIGKKWMCLFPGVERLSSRDFNEFCRDMKRREECEFYRRVWRGDRLSKEARQVMERLRMEIRHVEEICKLCKLQNLCPYEICCELGKEAKIIIADYYHIFEPNVRRAFFARNEKEVDKCILIIDEAHALPNRARNILSNSFSTLGLKRAIKEADWMNYPELAVKVEKILSLYGTLSKEVEEEMLIDGETLLNQIQASTGIEIQELIEELKYAGEEVREIKRRSYLGRLASFLEEFIQSREGFCKIFRKVHSPIFGEFSTIVNKCLDPSLATAEVLNQVKSCILMSGTLAPTEMYAKVLGIQRDFECVEYPSPFPRENRLVLIVPETTTKFKRRSEAEYRRIAKKCSRIVESVPGNVAIFFPSYEVRDHVLKFFSEFCERPLLVEKREFSKAERTLLYQKLKESPHGKYVLLAVAGASFAEGVDFSGGSLLCVIIVGIPLEKPQLEIRALIQYYQGKFKAGWKYGYIFPAMVKVIQAAGRLIRSEKDFGVVVLLDERFVWKNYYKCLPKDWNVKISLNPEAEILRFFGSRIKNI